jgi:N-acetylglucosamine kinase-like BadF-type ATPase
VVRGLEERLRARFPAARGLRVADDTLIALRSGVPEGPGIVLIAGTGSVAYAENAGKQARIGGAGYLLGDEGSGFAIGLAALRALARVFDGRARADAMTELVSDALNVQDRDALLAAIYSACPLDVARIAGLAAGVVALASEGDRAAAKIVQAAARDLGDLAIGAAAQVELRDRSPSVVLHGGLLRENSVLTYLLQTRLRAELPGAELIRAEREPASAALRLAEAMLAA